ncbi:putative HMP/thiamine import ATP-binding protein YkoD [compost metagenome]
MDHPESIRAIELNNMSFAYESGGYAALEHVTLHVEQGEWIAIAGRSGSGKSTLAQLLSGYLPRTGGGVRSGELLVGGIDPAVSRVSLIAERIGVVFQDPDAQLVQGRVEDEVAFGPENLCCPPDEIELRVAAALAAVDLPERRMDSVHLLSGGGRQRIAIASVLSLETPILVLDEATASLDASARQRLLSLLHKLHQEGRTIVTLSGRIDELAQTAPRMIVLSGGSVVMDASGEMLLEERRSELEQMGLLPFKSATAAEHPSIAEQYSKAEQSASKSTSQTGQALLDVRGLDFTYAHAGHKVLQNVSATLHTGQWCLLCGENGSGKTTLSRLLIGLLSAPKGTIWWQGKDISKWSPYKRAEEIGYVFQEPEQQFVCSTVWDELLYGPRMSTSFSSGDELSDHLHQRGQRMLEMIGLQGKEQTSPYLLSGGEKRLLNAASIFMTPKKLYILDEPTAGMDYTGADKLSAMCRQAVAEGASIIIITHEPERFRHEAVVRWNIENHRLLIHNR